MRQPNSIPATMTADDEVGLIADPLRVVTAGELVTMEFPPREMVLSPLIPTQGLCMIHAKRGAGKTYIGLGIAYAVASGGQFLRWSAPRPRRVLYIDGEMPAGTMRDRLAAIIAGSEAVAEADYLRIITPDLQDCAIPSLATIEGQAAIEIALDGAELVVVDNISTLCAHGRENEAESWLPLQRWVLALRRRGISVLLIHHSGKGGAQRGTSRREDILDTVLGLRHPADYQASDGLRVEIHVEKGRGIHGTDAAGIEARMDVIDGAAQWTVADLDTGRNSKVTELLLLGMSVREVADELGIPKSTVHRIKTRGER